MVAKRKSPIESLEKYHVKDPISGCWLWTASLFPNGYGQTRNAKSQVAGAHRVSYESWVGQIPKGLFVCHKCDVRNCINPEHLFLGTSQHNQTDMTSKGRSARGSRQGSAKLTENDVIVIRARLLDGHTQAAVAKDYGVTQGAIWFIAHRVSWKHVI